MASQTWYGGLRSSRCIKASGLPGHTYGGVFRAWEAPYVLNGAGASNPDIWSLYNQSKKYDVPGLIGGVGQSFTYFSGNSPIFDGTYVWLVICDTSSDLKVVRLDSSWSATVMNTEAGSYAYPIADYADGVIYYGATGGSGVVYFRKYTIATDVDASIGSDNLGSAYKQLSGLGYRDGYIYYSYYDQDTGDSGTKKIAVATGTVSGIRTNSGSYDTLYAGPKGWAVRDLNNGISSARTYYYEPGGKNWEVSSQDSGTVCLAIIDDSAYPMKVVYYELNLATAYEFASDNSKTVRKYMTLTHTLSSSYLSHITAPNMAEETQNGFLPSWGIGRDDYIVETNMNRRAIV